MAKKKAKASQAADAAKDTAAAKPASGAAGKQGSDKNGAQNQKAAGKGSQNAAQGKKADKQGAQDKKGQGQQAGIGAKATQLKEFFEESKVELKKVTWPSRKETVSTCIAVIVLTIVMSLYLGVVDLGLSQLVSIILS